jgi:hypothetical protein
MFEYQDEYDKQGRWNEIQNEVMQFIEAQPQSEN